MYLRINYEVTEEEIKKILDACKPVPYMVVGGIPLSSPQENANRAWAALGKEKGFDHMTVQPIAGKGHRFFTAVPSETESQRTERIKVEAEAKRKTKIEKLLAEKKRIEDQLASLAL